ncbi:hypothetical protein AWB64_01985 [Caballeronia sordidicola]|uniref:Uncharacterized protein n=1 Tax=Caballeronia sordidicola TaxID=196367 RepID=A0A158FYG4_CABSO|nr:hypothetical protein [Caballeronia sordidicola]SAL24928.1 hypothetical protein AWB64_01985 [Caballeronia sordidicola]
MTPPQDSPPIPERVRLVIALTEVNSRYLRGENRCAGAEIELACALACEKREGVTPDRTRDIAQLRERLSASESELLAVEAERAWLEDELANFDSAEPGKKPGALQ